MMAIARAILPWYTKRGPLWGGVGAGVYDVVPVDHVAIGISVKSALELNTKSLSSLPGRLILYTRDVIASHLLSTWYCTVKISTVIKYRWPI